MVIDDKTKESIRYLLEHLDSFIEEEAYRVLADSEEDPQHSAVTLCNLIINYLHVMKAMGQEAVPTDVTGYLMDNCFTEAEISALLEKKAIEAKYYIGKQL